jgi:two-component system response regulator MprA
MPSGRRTREQESSVLGVPERRGPRLLLIDGDPATRDPLIDALRLEGFAVEATADGGSAVQRAVTGTFDAVIVDIALPGFSGLAGCRSIRSGSDVPILVVTAEDTVHDRILGLESGADVHLGKPVSAAELVTRIRAVLRRRRLDCGPPGGT